MLYFVRTEFFAGGFLRTHTVCEFTDAMAAVEFATSQTGAEVVSTLIYSNEEAA